MTGLRLIPSRVAGTAGTLVGTVVRLEVCVVGDTVPTAVVVNDEPLSDSAKAVVVGIVTRLDTVLVVDIVPDDITASAAKAPPTVNVVITAKSATFLLAFFRPFVDFSLLMIDDFPSECKRLLPRFEKRSLGPHKRSLRFVVKIRVRTNSEQTS